MKKIKLFLITLLCMVGVMNVAAQDVITQVVNSANGTLNRGAWQSNAGYGANGEHLIVDDDAVLNNTASVRFRNGNLQFHLVRTNTITIKAPAGYVIDRYVLKAELDRASINCGVDPDANGNYTVNAIGKQQTTFFIETSEGDLSWDWNLLDLLPNVTFANFVVYLSKEPVSDVGLYDAEEQPIVPGAMYVLSTEISKEDNSDKYFSVVGQNVVAGGWPGETDRPALVDVKGVWEMSLLDIDGVTNKKRITLKSMLTDKYFGNGTSPVVTAENKAAAMQFDYNGPLTTTWYDWYITSRLNSVKKRTKELYNLISGDKYLTYVETTGNDFVMEDDLRTIDINEAQPQRFRFHRVDYARIGVFTERNGVLDPMHFTVNTIVGKRDEKKGLSDYEPVPIEKYGQSEICCEYHVTTKSGKATVTEHIGGRIKKIVPLASEVPAGIQPKIIINGAVVDATDVNDIDYDAISSGYNISIIYELPDDPTDPDPIYSGVNFYRLKTNAVSDETDKYLSAVKSGNTVELKIADNSNDAIFYSDGTSLLSYTNGVYVKDNVMGEIEEQGSDIKLAKFTSSDNKWDVRLGSQYLTCDNGGGDKPIFAVKPSGEYDLIPVTELPVFLNEVGGHRYGTFYAPVDVKVPTGSKLETYVGEIIPASQAGGDFDILHLTRVYEVPANTGVIVYEENATSNTYTLKIEDIGSAGEDESALTGTFARKKVSSVGENIYGLNEKNGKVGFYKMTQTSKLSSFRAYLDYAGTAESKGFICSFSDTDAIEAIEMSHADDAIYDLQGRRVQNPGTGIYIVNGKKVMITK